MFGATACNTIEGMGEDAEAAGDAAEDATDGE
ncbi:entericidin EcnAB [Aquisalinus flavus]|nr:entericidin EcnAB [Aquisalinus flavus]